MTKAVFPNFVDLFAGCGGLSLGLERAGFHPLFVNELNADAMKTYLHNRTQFPLLAKKYHLSDVKELVKDDGNRIDDLMKGFKTDYGIDGKRRGIDLVVGGPPCQGFSGIGFRRSYSVARSQQPSNYLFQDMAYVIHRLQPKAFLFENVGGLLRAKWGSTGEKGEIWAEVLETFENIPGYSVRWKLVHAKDYGVPQNRPRVLIVGLSEKLLERRIEGDVANGYLPNRTGGYPNLVELLDDLVDPRYENGGATTRYPKPARTEAQKWFRQVPDSTGHLGKGAELSDHEYSNHRPDIVEKFRYMLQNGGAIPWHMKTKKFSQRVLPSKWGPNGPSITATSLADDYVHYSQPRTLTVREWARLQTFPDWYEFQGKRTTGGLRRAGNPRIGLFEREAPKYTQIGNAVPVKLAECLGKNFLELLGYDLEEQKIAI